MTEMEFRLEMMRTVTKRYLNTVPILSNEEVFKYTADETKRNLLMVAADQNHVEAVKNLINRGFDVNKEINGETAASIACKNHNFEVLLILMNANSFFPPNYNDAEASDELKSFVEVSTNLRRAILASKRGDLEKILSKNQNLRYYFDLDNVSAMRFAITKKKFEMYAFLIEKHLCLAPHEDIKLIVSNLSERDRQLLKAIHTKFSHDNPMAETPIALFRNSFVSYDVENRHEKLNLILKAYNIIYNEPRLAIIMDIVAARRNVTINYDFNRESVQFMDTTADHNTDGLYYSNGHVFIAAFNLLVPNKEDAAIAVIAHELCHFAMNLVYENRAKPYGKDDREMRRKFSEISAICESKKGFEEIIRWVYECYDPKDRHAELIVRIPHMIVNHRRNKPLLDEKLQDFVALDDFYDKKVTADMHKALPRIKRENRTQEELKVLKMRRIIWLLVVLIAVGGSIGIFAGFMLFTPDYNWNKLTDDQRTAVLNAKVNYCDVDVKFGELFKEDSIVYQHLTSPEIAGVLKGNSALMQEKIPIFYDHHIFLKWNNLTHALKDKLLTSKVNFQGQNTSIGGFLTESSPALALISHHDVKSILKGLSLNISSEINLKANFLIERKFIDAGNFSNHLGELTHETCHAVNTEVKTLQMLVKDLENSQVFLLSDIAGEGKSTVFRHLGRVLKSKHPRKWVQFIDLKEYIDAYRESLKFENVQQVKGYLGSDMFNLNVVEREIFSELFDSSNVIFIFDGVDEISPKFNDFILNLIAQINNLTANLQVVSTRPFRAHFIKEKFKIPVMKLLPLGPLERLQFLVNYITTTEKYGFYQENLWFDFLSSQNYFENSKSSCPLDVGSLKSNIKTRDEFTEFLMSKFSFNRSFSNDINSLLAHAKLNLNRIESSRDKVRLITNPLLVRMIAEIALENDQNNKNFTCIYAIFHDFVLKKLDLSTKGAVWEKTKNEIGMEASLPEVHQIYALKLIFRDIQSYTFNFKSLNVNKLDIMRKLNNKKLAVDKISIFGIVSAESEHLIFTFVHQTFAEFFCSQYLMEKLESHNELDLVLLYAVHVRPEFEMVKVFMMEKFNDCVKPEDGSDSSCCKLECSTFNFILDLNNKTERLTRLKVNQKFIEYATFIEFTGFFTHIKNSIKLEFNEWSSEDFKDILDNWSDIKNIIGNEGLQQIIASKSHDRETLIHEILATDENLLLDFLEKTKEVFNNREDVRNLLSKGDHNGKNLVMDATYKITNAEILEKFFTFVKNSLKSDDELRDVLNQKSLNMFSSLHYATFNGKNSKSFSITKDFHQKVFSDEEIRGFLTEMRGKELPYPSHSIYHSNTENCLDLTKYLEESFRNDKMRLRNFLSVRNASSYSIFMTDVNNVGYFERLLSSTFVNENDFKLCLKDLRYLNRTNEACKNN